MKYQPGIDIPALSQDGPLFVKFSATWCNPCKNYAPILQAVADELGMQVFDVDIDEHADLALEHVVRGVPTTLVFDKGQMVTQFVGAASAAQIKRLLNKG